MLESADVGKKIIPDFCLGPVLNVDTPFEAILSNIEGNKVAALFRANSIYSKFIYKTSCFVCYVLS